MQQLTECLQKTEKAKVVACFQTMPPTNEPVANVIGGIVQLYALSLIPDDFQCVAEMVLDRLPKSSTVDFIRDTAMHLKKTQLSSLSANNGRETSKILLNLLLKAPNWILDRFHSKRWKQKAAYQISV